MLGKKKKKKIERKRLLFESAPHRLGQVGGGI